MKFDFIQRFRKKYTKPLTDEEYKTAGDYLMQNATNDMIERDLLLRGMPLKNTLRVIQAANKLRGMAHIRKPEPKIEKLKGGILDGIRRS